MTISPGAALRDLRERRPLVHQITNYVVMNETANATLALGALPVMAHAPQEVEEMAARRRRARAQHRHALASRGSSRCCSPAGPRTRRGVPVVLDPVGAGATRYRTETARLLLDGVDVAVVRGNAAEVATLAGREAEIRGVESIGAGDAPAELAREAARALGCVAAVTGPVDHVSDGERGRRGRERPRAARLGHRDGLHLDRAHRLLPRRRGRRSRPRSTRSPRSASAAEDAAQRRARPGHLPRALYDALAALDPDTLDEAREVRDTPRPRERPRGRAPCRRGGRDRRAAAPQGRAHPRGRRARPPLPGARAPPSSSTTTSTRRSSSARTAFTSAARTPAPSARSRPGSLLGLSAASVEEARDAERRGAAYVGAGPVWPTPSKQDADPRDRARRPARDLRGRARPGGRDRRHRRDERRATASAPARPGSP